MDRSPTDTEIEWLDDGDSARQLSSEVVGRSSRWWIPLGVLVAVALAIAVPPLLGAGPSVDDSGPEDERAEAERARAIALGAVSLELSEPTAGGDTNALHGHVVAELRGLAELDLTFRAVLTSPDGDDARLVSVSGSGDVRVAPLPHSTDFRFDTSGQWLAGISQTTDGGQEQVLWAGRVGSSPKPVAVSTHSYAWHDSAPGVLAWTEGTDRELMTLALDGRERPLSTLIPTVVGEVEGWGDWGFALLSSGVDLTTAVLDPNGTVVEPSLSGRLSGRLPTGELLLTGGLEDPIAFDPSSGRVRDLPWLDSGRYVRSSAMAGGPSETILVVGNENEPPDTYRGEITRLVGDALDVVVETEAVTDIAWSTRRRAIVFADQERSEAGSSGRIRLIDRDGIVDAVLIPDLFRGREWVAALSVH